MARLFATTLMFSIYGFLTAFILYFFPEVTQNEELTRFIILAGIVSPLFLYLIHFDRWIALDGGSISIISFATTYLVLSLLILGQNKFIEPRSHALIAIILLFLAFLLLIGKAKLQAATDDIAQEAT